MHDTIRIDGSHNSGVGGTTDIIARIPLKASVDERHDLAPGSARVSKHAVLEERVNASQRFGGVEGGGAGGDAVRRERGLRGVRNWFLRERMRKRLERGVVLEREVHAFVGFDENQNSRTGVGRWRLMVGVAPSIVAGHSMLCPYGRNPGRAEDDVVRVREARGVALPVGERRDVVRFPGHNYT